MHTFNRIDTIFNWGLGKIFIILRMLSPNHFCRFLMINVSGFKKFLLQMLQKYTQNDFFENSNNTIMQKGS